MAFERIGLNIITENTVMAMVMGTDMAKAMGRATMKLHPNQRELWRVFAAFGPNFFKRFYCFSQHWGFPHPSVGTRGLKSSL